MSRHQIREVRQVIVKSALAANQSRKITIFVDGPAPKVPANVTVVAEDGSLPPANLTMPGSKKPPPQPVWHKAGRTYLCRQDDGVPGCYVIEGGGGELMAGLTVEIEAH